MSTPPSSEPTSAAAHETIKKMAAAAVNQERAPKAGNASLPNFKSFVSENTLEESRMIRKQLTGEDTEPDVEPEVVDNRPLYERLKEQKMKKQEEFEESKKFKNQIRGLDDEEADFLKICDDVKLRQDRERLIEEMRELEEFEKKAAELQAQDKEKELEELKKRVIGHLKPSPSHPSSSSNKKGQAALLASIIKRKATDNSTSPSKKAKSGDTEGANDKSPDRNSGSQESKSEPVFPTIKCMGVLPSLVGYAPDTDSSDSENSSLASDDDSCENVKHDFAGHKLFPGKKREKAKESAAQ